MPSNSNDLQLPVTGRCKTILGMARLRPVPALTLPNVHCGDGTCGPAKAYGSVPGLIWQLESPRMPPDWDQVGHGMAFCPVRADS